MSAIIIRNGRIIDPANKRDEIVDLAMVNGEARHRGIRIDFGEVAQFHEGLFLRMRVVNERQHLRHIGFPVLVRANAEHRSDPADRPAHHRCDVPAGGV